MSLRSSDPCPDPVQFNSLPYFWTGMHDARISIKEKYNTSVRFAHTGISSLTVMRLGVPGYTFWRDNVFGIDEIGSLAEEMWRHA
jgi:hypothetical protein